METNQVQKLLLQLRNDYINELSPQCGEIENLVLSLAASFKENYEELYRRVHSMKGSAGTHGLEIITSICHHLEEQLNGLEAQGGRVTSLTTDLLLRYVDLMRRARNIAVKNGSDFSDIEKELEKIRQRVLEDQYPVMLVESSGYVKLLCVESLKKLPLNITLEDDGLTALGLLLRNRYSLLITTHEAKTLNGTALISALRASDSVNKNIETIMLTSRDSLQGEMGGERADYVVNKNTALGDALPRAVREIISHFKDSSVNYG